MIVDIHTHIWTQDAEDTWASFVRECRRNAITLAIVSCLNTSEHYPSPEAVREANARGKQFDTYAGSLTRWLAYINPQNANWRDEMAVCLNDGV